MCIYIAHSSKKYICTTSMLTNRAEWPPLLWLVSWEEKKDEKGRERERERNETWLRENDTHLAFVWVYYDNYTWSSSHHEGKIEKWMPACTFVFRYFYKRIQHFVGLGSIKDFEWEVAISSSKTRCGSGWSTYLALPFAFRATGGLRLIWRIRS